ncbi:hypothetical protein M422DRAFT_164275 [Sphaerobolus stellatus SS14]|nr:hypothetical protein M422DRAFT_164275 [Sphaerobolus stellatus SS14]
MTVDNGILPSKYTYNALILACARSKDHKLDAFRLARQMINTYRDAEGKIPTRLVPDRHTFLALLDAAKRMGDLSRTRGLLGLMVKESGRDPRITVDQYAMIHVFHSYSAYIPPFDRDEVIKEPQMDVQDLETEMQDNLFDAQSSFPSESSSKDIIAPRQRRSHPPQTAQEIVREASLVWSQILQDQPDSSSTCPDDPLRRRPFRNVQITGRLVDAYLAVHFSHNHPQEAYQLFQELYSSLGVEKDYTSYYYAIDAYCSGKKKHTRQVSRAALDRVNETWKEWRAYEDNLGVQQIQGFQKVDADETSRPRVHARKVEKIWAAYIKLLALNWKLDEAVAILHEFISLYPPAYVKEPLPKDPRRSNRVILFGDKPLVRLTEPTTVAEDRISPFLTFRDIEVLHGRCVRKGRKEDIQFITWVGKAYEGSLRRKRDLLLKGNEKDIKKK